MEENTREMRRVLKAGGSCIISHLLSSREIAALHREIKGSVSRDTLPSEAWMREKLSALHFAVEEFRDQKGLYLLRARKTDGDLDGDGRRSRCHGNRTEDYR